MILDQTYGAIQQMPTAFGWDAWTWSIVPAAAEVAIATTRFDLIGTDAKTFKIAGTDASTPLLIGANTKKFKIVGE